MNKKLIANFSWWFFLVILSITVVGVVVSYSANHGRPEAFFRNLYFKQSLDRIKNGIICGEPLSKLYSKESFFPYIVCELTTAADETG